MEIFSLLLALVSSDPGPDMLRIERYATEDRCVVDMHTAAASAPRLQAASPSGSLTAACITVPANSSQVVLVATNTVPDESDPWTISLPSEKTCAVAAQIAAQGVAEDAGVIFRCERFS
jgi:hypothetical protein